ncbi:amino acid ABC transporter permease [Rhizobium leguminosarum bv. trifolii]|uniref:Glutamate/aspartate import permease protein GltK n=1 Tax=Rhizobium leguminosarum bv. trifolii TaxID=386 RepID=A0A3E1BFV2_RHILT|nr:amino acid ABC transporter permease [Rhizobium leguminosarum]RFB90690.1 amino acid ABC transporter permease [Rhizobium leguminosarum bv. trifolii]RFB91062.1 amino acid ABC transporter permease [Rhizobium leguminosarum bv. trifolii]
MSALDFSVVFDNLPYLWKGLQFSLMLTAVGFAMGMILGTGLALLQHLEIPVGAQFARGYVALIRSIPLILVLFWFFFLVPLIIGAIANNGRPVPIGGVWTAFITFSLFEAAYYSEIIRVGLRSLNKGQYEAAQALSLSTYKTYRFVILPQVVRVASPIILSQTIILFQDTSLVYVLSLTDLVGAASKLAQLNGRLVETYLAVAVIYLAICSAASQLVAHLRRRTQLALGR